QYQNYPQQNYMVQQYETITCNDLLCGVDECCVETHRSAQCVALLKTAAGQVTCARPKKCSKSADCPTTAQCCAQVFDATFAKPQSCYDSMYGPYNGFGSRSSYGDSYSYDHSYGYSKANEISSEFLSSIKEGYCIPPSPTGPCFRPVGADVPATCPCSDTTKVCKMILEPFPIGIFNYSFQNYTKQNVCVRLRNTKILAGRVFLSF
ncbi:hypothetical protein BgiBS90_036560, partial [Biomphalaria glabrata]